MPLRFARPALLVVAVAAACLLARQVVEGFEGPPVVTTSKAAKKAKAPGGKAGKAAKKAKKAKPPGKKAKASGTKKAKKKTHQSLPGSAMPSDEPLSMDTQDQDAMDSSGAEPTMSATMSPTMPSMAPSATPGVTARPGMMTSTCFYTPRGSSACPPGWAEEGGQCQRCVPTTCAFANDKWTCSPMMDSMTS